MLTKQAFEDMSNKMGNANSQCPVSFFIKSRMGDAEM